LLPRRKAGERNYRDRPQVSTEPIVVTQALARRFGDQVAVDALSLEVPGGEVFGLLGRNGAGKTTVIKMLTTLLPPTSGSARIAGFDIVREAAAVRRLIGYVPQALSADGELTGYENLLVFAQLYDVPRADRKARIAEALEFMGLSEASRKLVKSYSGGMIRRLEIAQSTLHRPAVLFLDEPTIGLDPLARHAVWEQVGKLRERSGSTILVTTHYMEEAERLCDRVGILNRGRLAALGTPQALRAQLGAGSSLDDVFERYTGDALESTAGYLEASRTRRRRT
jgi:ABC-2 type transport system ATP-binding protein